MQIVSTKYSPAAQAPAVAAPAGGFLTAAAAAPYPCHQPLVSPQPALVSLPLACFSPRAAGFSPRVSRLCPRVQAAQGAVCPHPRHCTLAAVSARPGPAAVRSTDPGGHTEIGASSRVVTAIWVQSMHPEEGGR